MALRYIGLTGGTVPQRGCVQVAFRFFDLIYPLKTRGIGFLSSLLPKAVRVELPLAEVGGTFSFFAHDKYWSKMVIQGHHYEPEVSRYLARYGGKKVLFIDGGANNGYWTIYAAKRFGPGSDVWSVEANPLKYQELSHNVLANGLDVTATNRALSDVTGDVVDLDISKGHASASILPRENSTKSVRTETITIDDMLEETLRSTDLSYEAVILKLDVEGVEVRAIEGAARLREIPGLVILYEDHGLDDQHETTRFLMLMGYSITFLGDDDQPGEEIIDLRRLDDLKGDKARGYNFVATSQIYEQSA